MDKVTELNTQLGHGVSIQERKSIIVSGVKKIDSFDSEEFLMDTSMGYVIIKGSELEIVKLDTFQGNVSIKGRLDSLTYLDSAGKKEKGEGILTRLFK